MKKTGMVPFPITRETFPQQHVVVGQLGLKLHDTQHLAPDGLPPPTPGPVSINTAQMALQSFSGPTLPL